MVLNLPTSKWEGQKYKLYGFQGPQNQIVSSSQMMKRIRRGALAYAVQCHQLEMLTLKLINEVALEVQELIQKHEKVFQGLPMKMHPIREIEHKIEVKAGSRVHAEPARAHAEAARRCAVPRRANVSDAEGQRTDAVPPEAEASQARVTLG